MRLLNFDCYCLLNNQILNCCLNQTIFHNFTFFRNWPIFENLLLLSCWEIEKSCELGATFQVPSECNTVELMRRLNKFWYGNKHPLLLCQVHLSASDPTSLHPPVLLPLIPPASLTPLSHIFLRPALLLQIVQLHMLQLYSKSSSTSSSSFFSGCPCL